jgi:hypothetical protein
VSKRVRVWLVDMLLNAEGEGIVAAFDVWRVTDRRKGVWRVSDLESINELRGFVGEFHQVQVDAAEVEWEADE